MNSIQSNPTVYGESRCLVEDISLIVLTSLQASTYIIAWFSDQICSSVICCT